MCFNSVSAKETGLSKTGNDTEFKILVEKHKQVVSEKTICKNTESYNLKDADSIAIKIRNSIDNINSKTLKLLNRSYSSIQKKIEKKNGMILKKMQEQEIKLQKKLLTKDSTLAKQEIPIIHDRYQTLLNKIKSSNSLNSNASHRDYIPGLDSITAILKIFQIQSNKVDNLIPTDKLTQIKSLNTTIVGLQNKFNQSADIQQFISERKQELQQIYKQYGLENQLYPLKKEIYYYQQQVNEYKEILHDENKVEQKLLSIIREQSFFQEFMKQNSFLAQYFPIPTGYGSPQSLTNLQSRNYLEQQISRAIGGGSNGNPEQFVQDQMQQAQSQLEQLKNKINQLGGGNGSVDLQMPDFKPNNQKSKSILRRLEFGFNIQSQKPNGLLPVTTDFAVTTGYKLNDKSIIGIGVSYKMGWGNGIKDIRFSNQGFGLRSYLDIKIKSGIWISGGYEQNYMQAFAQIPALNDYSKWQRCGLVGLTKKYKIGKKTNKIQLLWDFLSYQQVPKTQPLLFRMGYSF